MLVTEIDIVGLPSNACDGQPKLKRSLKSSLTSNSSVLRISLEKKTTIKMIDLIPRDIYFQFKQ